jgi:hypothetical protein
VQGKLNTRGNYEVKMRPESVQALQGQPTKLTPVGDQAAQAAVGGPVKVDRCNSSSSSSNSSSSSEQSSIS